MEEIGVTKHICKKLVRLKIFCAHVVKGEIFCGYGQHALNNKNNYINYDQIFDYWRQIKHRE
jgi:hypothetical protein